jgi:hypothetical protein
VSSPGANGKLAAMLSSEDKTQLRLQKAIRLTSLGAQLSIATVLALLAGDLACQIDTRHPAILFGVTGRTVSKT